MTKKPPRAPRRKRAAAPFETLESRAYLAAHIVGNATSYATIQAAVNAAAPGATINVDAGTYAESVTINKSINLRGAQAGVDGRGARGAESIISASPTAVRINADDVTIDGFTVLGTKANIGANLGAGVYMAPSIHGTHVYNNVIKNNVTGLYLSNDSDTDAAIIQRNLFYNNYETGSDWTYGWNGSRQIYTDGEVSGGVLRNVLIDANTFKKDANATGEAMIALAAQGANKQFDITVSRNTFVSLNKSSSKAILVFNTTNLTFVGNESSGHNDTSSGSVRFEGNADNVNIQYNSIHDNAGPGIAIDSAGVEGDSSGFVVRYNNIYNDSTNIGLISKASDYEGPLVATNNWWGNATGPSGQGTGTGQAVWGDGVTGHYTYPVGKAGGNVTFSPWATAQIGILNLPAPAVPTGLAATAASPTSATLTWTAPYSTATRQRVMRSTDGKTFVAVATLSPLVTRFVDAGLTTGQKYYYAIVAVGPTTQSAQSVAATVTPALPQVPAAPTGLKASAASTGSIGLTWTAAAPAPSSYTVQRSKDNVTFTTVATGVAGTATAYTDPGLSAGTTYYYRLVAVNAAGSSVASAVASATTLSAATVQTSLSTVPWTSATSGWQTPQLNTSVAGNPITLRGKTYASGIGTHAVSSITYNLGGNYAGFQADVGIDDAIASNRGAAVAFQVYGDGVLRFDSGVLTRSSPTVSIAVSLAGVQTLRLLATNGVAGSIDYDHADWAGATLLSSPKAPAAPTGVTATAVSSTSVRLKWVAPAGNTQTGFRVERSPDGKAWTPVATLGGSTVTYADTGLTAGTTYSYRVFATNAVGTSVASSTVSAKTLSASLTATTALSSLAWTSESAGWGTTQKDASIAGNALSLRGTTYASGLGTHAASQVVYDLSGGSYTTFLADVGIDDEVVGKGVGSAVFKVYGDGVLLYDSGVVTSQSAVATVAVSVAGVRTLTLVAEAAPGGDIDFAHADWAGARLLSEA